MIHYWDFEGLTEIDLEASFVTGIHSAPGVLDVELDLALEPGHPSFEDPSPGDYRCYKRGRLRFNGVTSITWRGQGNAAAVDAAGESDLGHIEVLDYDKGYSLVGEFGSIDFEAEFPPVVEILRTS